MKFLFIILGFLSAFNSPPDILVPAWYDPALHSEKVNIIEYSGITVYAENLEVNSQHIIFDIEIVNNSTIPLNLDPMEVKLFGSDKPFPADVSTETSRDFESGLPLSHPLSEKEVAGDLMGSIKKKENTGTILGILTAGMVIFDAAMDVRDLKTPEWTPKKQRNSEIRNLLTIAGITATDAFRHQHAVTGREAREDLHFLEKEIYRFGRIPEGENVRGKMFFPGNEAQNIRLILNLNHTEFVLDFRWADTRDIRSLD